MKKLVFSLIFIGIIFYLLNYWGIITIFNKKDSFVYAEILEKINNKNIDVNSFTIYGKHMNLKGTLLDEKDYAFILKNNEVEIPTKLIIKDNKFALSDNINDGLNLEKIPVGEYLMLLKSNEEYYSLINKTEYHDNTYYTFTKDFKNNLITFSETSYKDQNYWLMKVSETKLPEEYYDIVIDPGHGGIDTGAGNGKYHESKYTLEYAKALYDALTEEGFKVKLTRDSDIQIESYGLGSRTGIPYEVKAKLMLSIHLNSSASTRQRGVEIYKAYNDNDQFARILADNIKNIADIPYSNNPVYKVSDGIYMRVYSKNDIEKQKKDALKGGFEPYEIDDNTTYYYFIRETGGIMTKAFSDGRNPKKKANPYLKYNQGVENYLCELGYISQKDDLSLILNKKDRFVKALKTSVLSYVNE